MENELIKSSAVHELKEHLVRVAQRCSRSGLQTGDGGNLSARIPGQELMLIKASGASFGDSTTNSFVICDFDGTPAAGEEKPSRESLLHGAVYKKLPEIQAIVHCHSTWATGWASTLTPLPFATYHSQIKLGGEIRVFDTHGYTVPQEDIAGIMSLFDEYPKARAFLLKGHGQVALGTDIKNALHSAELVEETARIAVIERLLKK
ncbi:MAG: class II aldolase/adducin family protein [Negativicutes bacterium]|nr:class II aldolase/adducin family protein [Negativicutes bacterium]